MGIRRAPLTLGIIRICLVFRNMGENQKGLASREFTDRNKKAGESKTHFKVRNSLYLLHGDCEIKVGWRNYD